MKQPSLYQVGGADDTVRGGDMLREYPCGDELTRFSHYSGLRHKFRYKIALITTGVTPSLPQQST